MTDLPKPTKCPECGSTELIVREVTSWMLNTMEFYCHSVKAHDSDAEVSCLDCGAEGKRGAWENAK